MRSWCRGPGLRPAGTRLRRPGPRAQHREPGGHAAPGARLAPPADLRPGPGPLPVPDSRPCSTTSASWRTARRRRRSGRPGPSPSVSSGARQKAWARYESLVNEVLGPYAFHGLCTYDTQTLPAHVVAAAKATHPHTDTNGQRRPSPEYQDPSGFLATPLAGAPRPPSVAPTMAMDLLDLHDLGRARRSLRRALESSARVRPRVRRHGRRPRDRDERGADQRPPSRRTSGPARALGPAVDG